jgi:hypothetical protein
VITEHGVQDRVIGVWGANAYAWSGEDRPRAAGFPIDLSGRQRVLGFPADSSGVGHHGWFRRHAHSKLEPAGRRVRLVVAVVAILNPREFEKDRRRRVPTVWAGRTS